jgi:hypothetical protein
MHLATETPKSHISADGSIPATQLLAWNVSLDISQYSLQKELRMFLSLTSQLCSNQLRELLL